MTRSYRAVGRWSLVVVIGSVWTAYRGLASAVEPPATVQYVIQVAVDAMHAGAVEALGPTGAPNLWRMRTEGVYTDKARTDWQYTDTSPNHETEYTGRPVSDFTDQNGVLHKGHLWGDNSVNDPWASYGLTFHDAHIMGQVYNGTTYSNSRSPSKTSYEYVESVMDVAHDAGLRTGHYADKGRLVQEYESYNGQHLPVDDPNYGKSKIDHYLASWPGGYDHSVRLGQALLDDWTLQMASDTPLKYTFLHVDDPDHWGHHSTWSLTPGSDYLQSIQAVDYYVGRLFNVIDNDPRFKGKTAIVFTSDHGGVLGTTGHGNVNSQDDYEVPFYVWSPTISEVSRGAELYMLNPQYVNPGSARVTHDDMTKQPIRNGFAPNTSLQLLGLRSILDSTWNVAQDLSLNWNYSKQVLADDPVRRYRLADMGTTTIAQNTASHPSPDPSLGNATYLVAPSTTTGLLRTDPGNTSVKFDGQQKLTLPSDAEVNNGTFVEKTIELWFKPDAVTGRQVLYEQGDSTRGLNAYLADGKLYVSGWDTGGDNPNPWGGTGVSAKAVNVPIGAGDTHHATLVMKGDATGTNGSITGYLDGRPFGQIYGVGQLLPHTEGAVMGQVDGSTLYHDGAATAPAAFSGVLADVALYNKAISTDRVHLHIVQGTGKTLSFGSYGDALLKDGPTAYWQLGESSGNGAVNLATPVNAVGSGISSAADGRHVGGVTVGVASLVPGSDNGAVAYNGTDGGTKIPSSAGINTGANYPQRTISLWFHASDATPRQVLYEEGGQNDGLNVYVEGGQLHIGTWTTSTTTTLNSLGTAFDTAQAHHVTLALDSGSKSLVGMLDGRVFGASTGIAALPTHSNGIGIGRMNDESRFADGSAGGIGVAGDGYSLGGSVDDVAVFNQNLSVRQVRNHLAAAGVVVGAADAYEAAVQANNPTTYWRMNEPQGNGAANTAVGSATLGNAVTGTLNSNVTRNGASLLAAVPGHSSLVLTTATAGSAGGVSIPDHASINSGVVKQRSIEVWFNADDPTGRQVLYEEGGTNNGLNAYLEGGQLHLATWSTTNSVTTFQDLATPAGLVQASQTNHAVLVFDYDTNSDDSQKLMRGYINGAPFAAVKPTATIPAHTGNVGIGAMNDASRFYDAANPTTGVSQTGNGCYFLGRLGEVALYNSPLHVEDVQTHYAAGSGNRLGLPAGVALGATLNFDAALGAGNTTADDTIGTRDSAGNTLGWTLTNTQRVGPGISIYPGISQALRFDGTSKGVLSNNFTKLPGDPTTRDATFELWVKPSDFTGKHLIFEAGGGTDGVAFALEGSTLRFRTLNGGSTSGRYFDASYDLAQLRPGPASEFLQIVGEVDISGQHTYLFVNGNLVDQQGIRHYTPGDTTKFSDWAGTDGVALGNVNGTASIDTTGYTPFAGQIGMLRFYERALGPQEVLAGTVPIINLHTMRWNEPRDGQWSEAAWSGQPPLVPNYTADVVLDVPRVVSVATGGQANSVMVAGGGTLSVAASQMLSVTGAVSVSSGGKLALETGAQVDATSLQFDSGTLSGSGTLPMPLSLLAGGATISAPGTADVFSLTGPISGAGGLTKNGGGTVILSGSNSFGGGTSVDEGTLMFANALALPAGSNVTAGGNAVVIFSSGYTGAIPSGPDGMAPVPEPSTFVMLGAALVFAAIAARRGRAKGTAHHP